MLLTQPRTTPFDHYQGNIDFDWCCHCKKTVLLWRWRAVAIACAAFWLSCAMSSLIGELLGGGAGIDLQVISAAGGILALVCVARPHSAGGFRRRLLLVPGLWIAHVAMTVPASNALGLLMLTPGRERTIAEQKAIFILAALPVLVFVMRRSRLFTIHRPLARRPFDGRDVMDENSTS